MTLHHAAHSLWTDEDGGTELGLIRRAAAKAGELADVLRRLQEAAEARRLWDLPDRPYARTTGRRLHARGCFYVDQSGTAEAAGHRPLTTAEAEAFLREAHDHRRCKACQPDIPEPSWVRVRPASGRPRWRLAVDVELP